jgi:hypothetical protein
VHNQTTTQVYLEGGINVKTGVETYVAIRRIFEKILESPYSDCIHDLNAFSDYSRILFGYFADLNVTIYNQYLCLNLCYQDKLIDKCGCSSSITEPIRNAKYCESKDELDCEREFDFEFSASDTNLICKNVCQPNCEKVFYDLSISQATYPTESYYQSWMHQIKHDWNFTSYNAFEARRFMDHSFMRVIVNYGCIMYTLVEEKPAITFEEVIGNVCILLLLLFVKCQIFTVWCQFWSSGNNLNII